jgi:hypothetical protein
MNLSKSITAATVSALGTGLALAAPAQAGTHAAPTATHHTRLWTQVSGGRNGYADVTHAYTRVGSKYQGTIKYTLNHYRAPGNRNVLIMFRCDGTLCGYDQTHSSKKSTKTYGVQKPFKKVSMRLCLHKSGVTVHLNSGVSYCGAWWG